MKKLILMLSLAVAASSALAQINVQRNELGSGTPGETGYEQAQQWSDNIYHAPQYMPGYPTAATIFPRVLDLQCTKNNDQVNCAGFNWLPEMGRAEYLMVRPTITVPPAPQIQERIIIKEVPPKKKGE